MSDDLHDDLRIAIARLGRRMRLERAKTEVSDGQLSVLFVLWREGPQTLGSLSEYERVTPPSMNRTVNALVEAGLIERSSVPDDGRKVVLTITDNGLEITRETKRRRAAWFAQHLEGLAPEEFAALEAATPILRRLADS